MNPFCGATDTPVLDFWWCLLWVSSFAEAYLSHVPWDSLLVWHLLTSWWPAWQPSHLFHIPVRHRPLQCNKCNKFFQTQGALKLHSYKHVDGQFECSDCNKTFPFKSQLEQHKPSHNTDRPYKCMEKECKHSFSHEHDLKKHLKTHDGEEHYCPQCDYLNPDERLLKQHINKHLKLPKYFCKNCGKGHVYSMQLKRHMDKGC